MGVCKHRLVANLGDEYRGKREKKVRTGHGTSEAKWGGGIQSARSVLFSVDNLALFWLAALKVKMVLL